MNWQRWIRPGLLTTLVVTLVAVLMQSGPIARQLTGAVNTNLAAGGQAWAVAEASARDVTLHGVAPTPESQQAAMRLAAAVPGVHAVRDATSLLPVASPYIWSAQRTGRKIALSGSVPSEGSRVSVLAVARRALPEAEIVDTMVPARGAPEVFNAAVGFALGSLADLSQGTVTLNDSTLVIQGVARSASDYSAVQAAVRTQVPKAVVLGPVEIQPPRADPFVWSATYDGTAVVLAGYVPNDLVRQSLVAAVKATLPGVPVQDHAAVASGDPPGFIDAATFAISALNRLKRGGVTLDGLKLDVAGDAKSVDDYEAVVDGLSRSLPEGVQLVDTGINPAVVSPYVWKAERADGRVTLSGYTPSPQSRKDILALAQSLFGGDTIDSRLRVAEGEPRVDWLGGLKFALGQLASLDRGSVELDDKSYSIAGEAKSSDAFVALTDASAHTLPASLALKQADVVPPHVSPYRFAAVRRGTGIALTGNVGSRVQHQRIVDEVHRKFGSSEVVDQLTFASGAPDGFDTAVDAVLQAVSRLSGGQAMVEDTGVTISGYTYYPSGTTQVVQEMDAGLPDGYKVTADGIAAPQDDQPVSADQCRDLMQSVLALGSIGFDSGKSQLTKDGEGILDRAARVIARCPDTAVEVGAHTDATGGQARNREITQARAEMILEYLVAAGIKRERLTAVGYGETKPVADNATAAGKAANRRIEFAFTEPAG